MENKENLIKVVIALCVVVGSFLGGYYIHKPETVTKTEVVTVEKIVEKKVLVKDNTVVDQTIQKPDGTIEHTVTKNDVTTNSDTTEKTNIKKTETISIKPTEKNYSLGIQANFDLKDKDHLYPSQNYTFGRRIFGDIWFDGFYNNTNKDLAIGVRVEL